MKKQHHSADDHSGKEQYKRDISGSIQVRGDVECRLPTDLADQIDPNRAQKSAREKWQFRVSVLTLIFVIAYSGLTLWLAMEAHKSSAIAQRTFNSAQRPYVGVNNFSSEYLWDEKIAVKDRTAANAKDMLVYADIKNFGPVPATNFVARWDEKIAGFKDIPVTRIPDRPHALFPGQVERLMVEVGILNYQNILAGKVVFKAVVRINYDTANGHETECETTQYIPERGKFLNLGPILCN